MKLFRRQPHEMMSCSEVGKLLQFYLDENIDEPSARRLETHLHECRRCGMEAATYRDLKAALHRRRDSEESRDAVARLREFAERILVGDGPPERTDSPPVPISSPSWRTIREAVMLIARGLTFRTASRVALVVGTLLSAVNQGSVITGGNATATPWIRVVANYIIPYTVASIGYLAPLRHRDEPT